MRFLSIIIIAIISIQSLVAQNINGQMLLERSIEYHDPNQKWTTFSGELYITMETPNSPNRDSKIQINLPLEYFYINSIQGDISYEFTVNKGDCGTSTMNAGAIKKFGTLPKDAWCDKAKLYKNYYTYLYGLPMKLKDPGTIIDDTVERKSFKGKDFLVLKVSYDKSVGSDVWYFYFNPKTYAMEIYQFFKTDKNGELKLDSGEYILLTDTKTINAIKIPKIRAWYYNKDDTYLGTDILKD
ncbi:hypothetical protein A9Q86_06270 [Flavobacteriales bacterium 33_180_T64]|nr:hypothetical protein A9Q86_06270 [Flavobacteriales bacterium 33_180_T64]